MVNNNSKKILEKSYADLVADVCSYIFNHDEQVKAQKLSSTLEKAVSDNLNELKLQTQLLDFYKKTILKLKYVCLPALEDSEVISLIKNNFIVQFEVSDYDLLRKLNAKIINIIVFSDRDVFKENLRQAILENEEKITPNNEIKTIKDWLKNYVSEVGIEGGDKLIRAQYLMSLKNNKTIKDNEYNNLLVLFKLYDELNFPAGSPNGFSEEPPIVVNGKLCIFRKGVLEPVPNNKAVDEALALLEEGDNTEPINKTVNIANKVNAEDDDLFLPAKSPAVESRDEYSINLSELEQSLKNYPESSLEHKAISQEISRLKKSEFKQSQKADVN